MDFKSHVCVKGNHAVLRGGYTCRVCDLSLASRADSIESAGLNYQSNGSVMKDSGDYDYDIKMQRDGLYHIPAKYWQKCPDGIALHC